MVLRAFFSFLILFLVSCSDKNYQNKDFEEEFLSIITTFDEVVIIKDNYASLTRIELLKSFIENIDPQNIHFISKDVDEVLTPINEQSLYKTLSASVDIFYKRYYESLTQRSTFLNQNNFDFQLDEELSLRDRPRANSIQEKKAINRKIVKNELISQMLSNNIGLQEAILKVKQSYKDRISYIRKVRAQDKFNLLANNFLSILDPHSAYFSERDLENWNLRMNLTFDGIGAIIGYENETAKIEELMPGGPAVNSNEIKVGDKILSIGEGENGKLQNVVGWRLDDIVDNIRGDEGTFVQLEIENNSGRKIVTLERGKISLEDNDASSEIVDLDEFQIGYIRLPSFYSDTQCLRLNAFACKSATNDVKKILREFNLSGVDGLVFDLRNNGGGFLHEADSLTRLFINAGPTVQIKDSQNRITNYTTWQSSRSWGKPLVVLVNRFSASASEIFAGAIQDYNRGIIAGQKTFGKGSVQRFLRTLDGQIKLTDSLYYRISGEPTQIFGVDPLLEFPSLTDEEDYGEGEYDNALAPSSISKAVYFKFQDNWNQNVFKQHENRLNASNYYKKLLEIKNDTKANVNLSLNLQKRINIKEINEQNTLELVNYRRELGNLETFSSYDEYMESNSTEEFVIDAEIDQSLSIVMDLLNS